MLEVRGGPANGINICYQAYGVLTVNDGNEPKGKNLYLFTYGKVNN